MICKYCTCDAEEQKNPWYECPYDDCSGHDSCKGCYCQHLPVKEGQILRDE